MNTIKPLYRVILPILILLSLLSFASCSPQKKPDLEKAQKEAEEKKPPDELDKLKDSIKKVEKALEAIHEESKKPMFMQQEKLRSKLLKEAKKGRGTRRPVRWTGRRRRWRRWQQRRR